jgi:hypothetical protein
MTESAERIKEFAKAAIRRGQYRLHRGVLQKQCPSCDAWKAHTPDFWYVVHRKKTGRVEFMSACRLCQRARVRRHHNPHESPIRIIMKSERMKPEPPKSPKPRVPWRLTLDCGHVVVKHYKTNRLHNPCPCKVCPSERL